MNFPKLIFFAFLAFLFFRLLKIYKEVRAQVKQKKAKSVSKEKDISAEAKIIEDDDEQ